MFAVLHPHQPAAPSPSARPPHGARSAAAAAITAVVLTLAACAGGTGAPEAVDDDLLGSDPSSTVPEECAVYPLAMGPADIAEIDLAPADWPAPPEGAVLCLTSEATTGTSETASYATSQAIEDVIAYYESEVSGYELYRADGAETGTGYSTLDGTSADLAFQVRETDGGFLLVFGVESAS